MFATLIPVPSSNLRAVDYDPFANTLTIAFRSGGVYAYSRVPPSTYAGLMKASSHGSYFHANIKYRYPYRRLR